MPCTFMVTPEETTRIRSAAWIFLVIAVGVASWAAGVYTEFLLITGCRWSERHAILIYLVVALFLVAAFYFLHRQESQSHRVKTVSIQMPAPQFIAMGFIGFGGGEPPHVTSYCRWIRREKYRWRRI